MAENVLRGLCFPLALSFTVGIRLYVLTLLFGLLMLVAGAELLVRGGSQIALTLRVPALVVGLTIVAFGTSTPELATSVSAAMQASTEMALANVNGSNIANIALVLGVAAMVRPLTVDRALLRREIPFLVLLQSLVPLCLWNGFLGPWEGLVLLSVGLTFNGLLLRDALRIRRSGLRDEGLAELVDEVGVPTGGLVGHLVVLFIGIVILVTGAWLFVEGSVELAGRLGLSDRVIGLTCIALGTSAPELATAIVSSYRGQVDLAIGNVAENSWLKWIILK